jgi:hypothetical protein
VDDLQNTWHSVGAEEVPAELCGARGIKATHPTQENP